MIFHSKKALWSFMCTKVKRQLCKGNEVVISELSSPACPVKLLRKYLDKFQIPPDSRDLIFKPISRGKGSCKLVSPDKPISYSSIRDGFRRDLKNIGVDPSKLWTSARSLHLVLGRVLCLSRVGYF